MKFRCAISTALYVGTWSLFPAAPASGQFLLSNGDFSLPVQVPAAYLPVGSTIPGWTVVGSGTNNIHHVIQTTPIWPGNSSQFMDLTGITGNAGVRSSAFGTVSGQAYEITFDALNGSLVENGGQPGVPYVGVAFTAQATGGPLTTYSPPAGIPQLLSYLFTASGASTTLTFMDSSGYDSNAGWIDNVKIRAIPEPASISLLAAAIGLAGGRSQFRRSRRAGM